MIKNTQKTISHSQRELMESLKIPFSIEEYSTVNEAFNLGNINPPNDGSYPSIKYMMIGRGGHKTVTGSDGRGLVDYLQHGVNDANLFESVPFVLVPATDDISSAERVKYRIRVLETHGGVDYIAYYARVIDLSQTTVETRVIESENDVIVSDSLYVPTPTSQAPVPVDISNTLLNVASARIITTRAFILVKLTTTDINNIVSAVQIKYGDTRYATISEIGILQGFDVNTSSTIGGNSIVLDELQCGQIVNFLSVEYPLQLNPGEITLKYSLQDALPYYTNTVSL